MINLDQAVDLMNRIKMGYQPTDRDIQELQEYFDHIMPLLQAAMNKFVEAFAEALSGVLIEIKRVDDQMKLDLAISAHRDRIARASSLKAMNDGNELIKSQLRAGVPIAEIETNIAEVGNDRRQAMMNHPAYRGDRDRIKYKY